MTDVRIYKQKKDIYNETLVIHYFMCAVLGRVLRKVDKIKRLNDKIYRQMQGDRGQLMRWALRY